MLRTAAILNLSFVCHPSPNYTLPSGTTRYLQPLNDAKPDKFWANISKGRELHQNQTYFDF